MLAFRNHKFKILADLKIFAFLNHKFKILILTFQNSEFKIFADLKTSYLSPLLIDVLQRAQEEFVLTRSLEWPIK